LGYDDAGNMQTMLNTVDEVSWTGSIAVDGWITGSMAITPEVTETTQHSHGPEGEPGCTWETCSHWDDCYCPTTPCVDWLAGWRPNTFCVDCLGLGADDMYCVGSYIQFGSVDGACKFSDYDYYDWDSTYVDAVQVCDMSNHGHGEHSVEGRHDDDKDSMKKTIAAAAVAALATKDLISWVFGGLEHGI